MANEIVQRGIVSRLLRFAQKQPDGQPSTPAGLRTGPYGEQQVINILSNKAALAEEGSYFTNGMLPNSSTIVYGATTAYTTFATAYPLLVLQNNDSSLGLNVVPDFIKFQLTAAAASSTNLYLTLVLDQYRTPTAVGTNATLVPNQTNVNTNVGNQSVSNMWVPVTSTNMATGSQTGAARIVVRNYPLRVQIPVALDQYTIQFGSVDGSASGNLAVASGEAGVCRVVAQVPPVVLNPQEFMLVYLWSAGASGSWHSINYIEEGHYER